MVDHYDAENLKLNELEEEILFSLKKSSLNSSSEEENVEVKLPEIEVRIPNHKIQKFVGRGVYGKVYLVENEKKEEYIVKKIRFQDSSIIELDLLRRIDHPNIVKLFDIFCDTDFNIFLLEEVGVCLRHFVRGMELSEIYKVMFQVSSALYFLERNEILHFDIKVDNVIKKGNDYKLIDLGISSRISNAIGGERYECELYRAPELIIISEDFSREDIKKKIFKKLRRRANVDYLRSEMWSFGLFCINVLYGKINFPDSFEPLYVHAMENNIMKNYISRVLGKPKDEKLFSFISEKLLQLYPEKRLKSFSEFLHYGRPDVDHNVMVSPKEDHYPLFTEVGKYTEGTFSKKFSSEGVNIIIPNDRKYFQIVNNWVVDILKFFQLSNIVAFSILFLVRHLWNKYTSVKYKKDRLQLFAVSCINLMTMLFCIDGINEEELFRMTDSTYKPELIEEYSFYILMRQEGCLLYETLYDLLPSTKLLKRSVEYMKDERYMTMNHEEYTKFIFDMETVDEKISRIGKNLLNFNLTMEM